MILDAQKSRDHPLSNGSKNINFRRGKIFSGCDEKSVVLIMKTQFIKVISRKIDSKSGFRVYICIELDRFLAPLQKIGTAGLSEVVGTLLKLRLRRNLPRGFILVLFLIVQLHHSCKAR